MMINWTILLIAIMQVESGGCLNPSHAVGDNGASIGAYQIQKAVIDDCNRVYKQYTFTYNDRYDIQKSKQICYLYLSYWGNHYKKKTGKEPTAETLARIWNGGPNGYKKQSTIKYWNKVKKLIYEYE